MSTNHSKDRSNLCSFMFVDGRHCRIPRQLGHPYLCAFHAREEAQKLAGQKAGKDIAYHLSGSFVSACDLTSALGRLFSAVAQGHVKPKTASTLAYLGQTMVQALPLARDEYINAYDTDDWRETIRESHEQVRQSHLARCRRRPLACARAGTGPSLDTRGDVGHISSLRIGLHFMPN